MLLVQLLQLPAELAIGLIIVGACAGGTASNVMTYLAGGDVARDSLRDPLIGPCEDIKNKIHFVKINPLNFSLLGIRHFR